MPQEKRNLFQKMCGKINIILFVVAMSVKPPRNNNDDDDDDNNGAFEQNWVAQQRARLRVDERRAPPIVDNSQQNSLNSLNSLNSVNTVKKPVRVARGGDRGARFDNDPVSPLV
jgi:hypothetical protein